MTGGQNVKSVNNSLRATYNPTFYSQGIPLGHKRNGAVNDSKAMAGCCADVELPRAFVYLSFDGPCARMRSGLA